MVSALAHRDAVRLLPVLVPADASAPGNHPLTILLLAQLRQVTAERDAYREWVTQDPDAPSTEHLRAQAAEAASNFARRYSP